MLTKTHILLASRSKVALAEYAAKLAGNSTYQVDTRHIENGHSDPLWGLSFVPDIVVFALNERGHHDLGELIGEPSAGRPPMIVIAGEGDAQTMRLAMQAGARDFLLGEISSEDLRGSIERASAQIVKDVATQNGKLTVFVNAKGGSGATFIAGNVAHIHCSAAQQSTAVLSLDMQFESLVQLFDTELRHGLIDVLHSVDDLDAVALDAYLTQHESGLRMLAAAPEDELRSHGDSATRLRHLIDKMTAQYQHVIVDMPRRIDSFTMPVLEQADRIVLVVQQTLGHLRDAARMLKIFANRGVPADRVLVVLNRFDKRSLIAVEDVKRALQEVEVVVVPSDFATVSESINLGVPIYEHARGSAVTKSLIALESKLGGTESDKDMGMLSKAWSKVMRKQPWSQA